MVWSVLSGFTYLVSFSKRAEKKIKYYQCSSTAPINMSRQRKHCKLSYLSQSFSLSDVWNQIIQKRFWLASTLAAHNKAGLLWLLLCLQRKSWGSKLSTQRFCLSLCWARNTQAMTYREVEREKATTGILQWRSVQFKINFISDDELVGSNPAKA